MTLRKLEALLEAAEKARNVPNQGDLYEREYVSAAAKAAEDLARLLIDSHKALRDLIENDHEHDEYCNPEILASCPEQVTDAIEQRFGGDDALSL